MKTIGVTFVYFLGVLSALALNTLTPSSPSNGATHQNTNITLYINTVMSATQYDYMLDTIPIFDSPALR